MKRMITIVLAIVMIATVACQPVSYVEAKASPSKVAKAYRNYCKKYCKKNDYYSFKESYYNLYDFNKDGTKEMVVTYPGGARAACYVYTYYKGKVITLSSKSSDCVFFNSVYYISNKKYFIGYGSGGYKDYVYEVYKISKGKFKLVDKYMCDNGKFKKDGRKISKSVMEKFEKKLNYMSSKDYYF